jgi:hypothetical protein
MALRWPCQVGSESESEPDGCDRHAKRIVFHRVGTLVICTCTCAEHLDEFCAGAHVVRVARLSDSLPPPPAVVTMHVAKPVRRSA